MAERARTLYERVPEPPEPTARQCSDHATVPGGRACWYPQMGGYAGKAIAAANADGEVDVWVWHDGQFPFSSLDDSGGGPPRSPVLLHHCDPGQFIRFGQFLEQQLGEMRE